MTFDVRSFGVAHSVLAGEFEEADLEPWVGGQMDRCPKADGQRCRGWPGKVTHGRFHHFLWPWGYCGDALAFWGRDLLAAGAWPSLEFGPGGEAANAGP